MFLDQDVHRMLRMFHITTGKPEFQISKDKKKNKIFLSHVFPELSSILTAATSNTPERFFKESTRGKS